MNITIIIGTVIGFGLMIFGIGISNLGNFANIPSLVITIGGTFAAIFASYPIKSLKLIPKHMKIIISKSKYQPLYYIDIITDLANEARKKGLLALEEKGSALTDYFFRSSVMLIVDALDEAKVRAVLEGDLDNLDERHSTAVRMYQKAAGFAPAFGMIGTLIGLINMLKSMNMEGEGAAAGLGMGMSLALITTFYGSVLANVIFTPLANQLEVRHEEEMLCKQIIVEGVISIQAGENPKYIREKLISMLPEKAREKMVAGESGAKQEEVKEKKKKKGK